MGILTDITNLLMFGVTKSDSTVYSPPLKCVMVVEPGTLTLENNAGTAVVIEVAAIATGGVFPAYFPGLWRKVMSTGTDQNTANIFGLR